MSSNLFEKCHHSPWWFQNDSSLNCLFHDVVTLDADCNVSTVCCWFASGNGVDWMYNILCVTVVVCDWWI